MNKAEEEYCKKALFNRSHGCGNQIRVFASSLRKIGVFPAEDDVLLVSYSQANVCYACYFLYNMYVILYAMYVILYVMYVCSGLLACFCLILFLIKRIEHFNHLDMRYINALYYYYYYYYYQ